MTNQDLLLPFARMMQTRQPQLASDSFFEVKLSTLSKSFGAQNDNFFNMRSSILGNQGWKLYVAVCLHFLKVLCFSSSTYIFSYTLTINIHILSGLCNHESRVKSQQSIVHQHQNCIRQSIEKRKEKNSLYPKLL